MLDFIASAFIVPNYEFVMTVWSGISQVLPIVLVAAIFQSLMPATKRRPKFLSFEMTLDVFYALQPGLVYLSALGGGVAIAKVWLLGESGPIFGSLASAHLVFQVLVAVWLFDFAVYWRHRLEHELPFLWPFHAVHHSSKQIDVLTTTRLHFAEVMLGGVINGVVGVKLGLGPEALGWGFSIYLLYNYFVHSNVSIAFPGVLKYFLVSPLMHRWHHALEREAVNKNFGVVFAWNDWIFRSAYLPDREPNEFGFETDPGKELAESYMAHQLYPLKLLYIKILSYVKRPVVDRNAS